MSKLYRSEKIITKLQDRFEVLEKNQLEYDSLQSIKFKLKTELTCTLSMTLFDDPVHTDCGSIYEREFISKWLSTREREGQTLNDPCMGVTITKKVTPLPSLRKIVEKLKENCFEWNTSLLEKALQQVQEIKSIIIRKKSYLNVTVIFFPNGPIDSPAKRDYTLARTTTIGTLKSKVVADELGGFSDGHSRFSDLYSIYNDTTEEFENNTPLHVCGSQDNIVLYMFSDSSLSLGYDYYPSDEEDEFADYDDEGWDYFLSEDEYHSDSIFEEICID